MTVPRHERGYTFIELLVVSAIVMLQDMQTDGRNFYNDSHILLPLSDTLNGQDLPEQYYQVALNDSLGFDDSADLYNGKLEWTKPYGVFTASVSFSDRTTELRRFTDVSSEILFQIPADENPNYLQTNEDREIWSNEIRFASTWDGPVQLLAGVNYQVEDRDWSFSYWFTDVATGRLLIDHGPGGLLVAAIVAAGMASLVLAALGGVLAVAFAAAFVTGFAFGPVWPLAMAIGARDATPSTMAALVTAGNSGALVFPVLPGAVLASAGPTEGVAVTPLLCLLMLGLALTRWTRGEPPYETIRP